MPAARPTLVSLAEDLGVSRQTISNVINAPHLVRKATRLRVEQRIRETGYRPSAAAQALRNQRSRTISLRMALTPDGVNAAVMDRFLHHVVEEAQVAGYRITLITTTTDADEVRTLVREFEMRAIDGAILSDTSLDDLRPRALAEAGVPFACFGRPWGDPEATHRWVDIDGAAGTRQATQHLVEQGCRRVGFLGWAGRSGVGDDRRKGWLEVTGATDATVLDVGVHDGVLEGYAGMQALLAAGADGVVCASDNLGVGAFNAAISEGLLRGRRAPVIGFDDTPVARAIGMSSVSQPVEQAATLLVRGLIRDMTGKRDGAASPRQHLLAPGLALRDLGDVKGPPIRGTPSPASAIETTRTPLHQQGETR